MIENSLIYEFPLNERIRTFLKLEHQFNRFRECITQSQPTYSEFALNGFVDLYNFLSNSNADQIVLKEQKKYLSHLEKLAQTPSVDSKALDNILNNLKTSIDILSKCDLAKLEFTKTELFKTCAQRLPLMTGLMSFDTPLLHYWHQQNLESRQGLFDNWLEELSPVENALMLLMHLIRQCNYPTQVTAKYGKFKHSLKNHSDVQLIRIEYPLQDEIFPKISGNNQYINIQFFEAAPLKLESKPTGKDIEFSLTLCSLS